MGESHPLLQLLNSCGGRHNNGMHPTRDTLPVIKLSGVGGRVMPGVMLLQYVMSSNPM
jgi:hypothetical protein